MIEIVQQHTSTYLVVPDLIPRSIAHDGPSSFNSYIEATKILITGISSTLSPTLIPRPEKMPGHHTITPHKRQDWCPCPLIFLDSSNVNKACLIESGTAGGLVGAEVSARANCLNEVLREP